MLSSAVMHQLYHRCVVWSASLVLLGCASQISVRSVELDDCRRQAPSQLSPTDQHADLDALAAIMRGGYAGYARFPPAQWSAAFDALHRGVSGERHPTPFMHGIAEAFSFIDDNHMAFWVYDGTRRRTHYNGGHARAYVANLPLRFEGGRFYDPQGDELIGCADRSATNVVRPRLDGSEFGWRPVLRSLNTLDSIACEFRSEGATVERSFETRAVELATMADGPTFERRPAPFPWLRLRTLMLSQRGALEDFVSTAATLRDERVIVLDLRQSGGGSDRFLNRWFRELTSLDLAYWRTHTLRSEHAYRGAYTFWSCMQAFANRRDHADATGRRWIGRRVEQAQRQLERQPRGFYTLDVEEPQLQGLAPHPFRGRLVVAVDRRCGSACETVVLLARQLPGAIVVGENTEGTMAVGEIRWHRLPASRIWVSAGSRRHEAEGFRERYGFEPDLWLTGEHADRAISTLVECLEDPERCPPGLREWTLRLRPLD